MIVPGGEMAILGLPDNRVSLDLANNVVSKGITIERHNWAQTMGDLGLGRIIS